MKIYHGNLNARETEFFSTLGKEVRTLTSFYRMDQSLKKIPRLPFCSGLFLDSGAYSAYQQETEISLNEYVRFLHQVKDQVEVYAALDVIGDEDQSFHNFRAMWIKKLKPLPVFHYGESWETLEGYSMYTDYIGLGGSASILKPKIREHWLREVFSRFPGVRFHGFGITLAKILRAFPWHSVDGTYAHACARLGGIVCPWGFFLIIDSERSEIANRSDHLNRCSPERRGELSTGSRIMGYLSISRFREGRSDIPIGSRSISSGWRI